MSRHRGAKQVIKKAIPKSKKGKVAVAGAAAAGVALSKDSKPKETPGAITPSVDAQNANAPQGTGDAKTTLIGLPVATKIKAGTSGFPGIPYRLDYSGPTYTQADAVKGDAEKYLATKSASEKAALLLRLGQIPNLYSKGMAPNGTYVQSMGNRVIWRPEDAKALESILMVQDQLGDPTPDVTLTNLISNQTLSSKFFGRVSGTAKAVTPLAQIEAELNDKFLDLFETKPDINLVKAYAKEVNSLEASQSGISAQQKEDILLKNIQKKAKQLYKFAHKHFKSQSQIDQAHQAEKKLEKMGMEGKMVGGEFKFEETDLSFPNYLHECYLFDRYLNFLLEDVSLDVIQPGAKQVGWGDVKKGFDQVKDPKQRKIVAKEARKSRKTKLLGQEGSNPKLAKESENVPEFATKGLSLSPSDESGRINTCSCATKECRAACLKSRSWCNV